MTIEIWLAFAAAATVLLMLPGPTVLLVVAYALGQGRRVALAMRTAYSINAGST